MANHKNMARNEMATGEPGMSPHKGDSDIGMLFFKILGGLAILGLLLGPLIEN